MAAPRKTVVRPDFRVRFVVLEKRSVRAVAHISGSHHSPVQAMRRSHLVESHSATTPSRISLCQAEVASDGDRRWSLSHYLSVAEVLHFGFRGVVGGPLDADRFPARDEFRMSVSPSSSWLEISTCSTPLLDGLAGAIVIGTGGALDRKSSKCLLCSGHVLCRKSSNLRVVAEVSLTWRSYRATCCSNDSFRLACSAMWACFQDEMVSTFLFTSAIWDRSSLTDSRPLRREVISKRSSAISCL